MTKRVTSRAGTSSDSSLQPFRGTSPKEFLMTQELSLLVIESDDRARNDIEVILKSFTGSACTLATAGDSHEGMKIIQNSDPHIVILEVKEVEQGVKETAFILSRFPRTAIFVTAAVKNPDWILRLIRAGANEYLTKPVAAAELVDAVNKVARLHAQMSASNSKRGSVISVYNPSGGMGTTTVAVNLAATLAAQGKKTALIDLNLCSGDVAAFLDLAPRYTLSSVTAKSGQLDANFLKSVIVTHSSGIQVLSSPYDVGEAGAVRPELLQEVIALFRTIYNYTIIDTCGTLDVCNLATFDASDHVLFTTVLNLPALRNAKRYLAALQGAGIGEERVKLVVNRYTPKNDIKVADMEKILDTKTYQTVPNAFVDVNASINKGVPLVVGYPKSLVAKALEDLAKRLLTEPAAIEKHFI